MQVVNTSTTSKGSTRADGSGAMPGPHGQSSPPPKSFTTAVSPPQLATSSKVEKKKKQKSKEPTAFNPFAAQAPTHIRMQPMASSGSGHPSTSSSATASTRGESTGQSTRFPSLSSSHPTSSSSTYGYQRGSGSGDEGGYVMGGVGDVSLTYDTYQDNDNTGTAYPSSGNGGGKESGYGRIIGMGSNDTPDNTGSSTAIGVNHGYTDDPPSTSSSSANTGRGSSSSKGYNDANGTDKSLTPAASGTWSVPSSDTAPEFDEEDRIVGMYSRDDGTWSYAFRRCAMHTGLLVGEIFACVSTSCLWSIRYVKRWWNRQTGPQYTSVRTDFGPQTSRSEVSYASEL